LIEIETPVLLWIIRSHVFKAFLIDLFLVLPFFIFGIIQPHVKIFNLIFIFVWILSSYVLGRYSNEQKSKPVSKFVEISRLIASSIISLLVVIIFYFDNLQIYNNQLEILFLFLILSFTFQYIFKIKNKDFKISNWLHFAEKKDLVKLRKYLNENDLKINLKSLNLEKHNFEYINQNFKGIVITNFDLLKKEQIKKLKLLKYRGIKIISRVSWCENVLKRIPSELIEDSDLIIKGFLEGSNSLTLRIKRVGDIFFGSILLILSSPIVLLSAFLIWFDDKGPIFYSQIRTGYKKRHFRIWKLRTMRENSEVEKKAIWAKKNDPRVTKIGVFLRKCRIDELPQLINVINGSMSLIGPRPERPSIEKTLEKQIQNYDLRFFLKPGLSGWAQVNYPYGASIRDSRIKCSYDIFYIRNQSLLIDFWIFFKTIRLVFNLQGSEPK